ncbi:MAG: hypothetical protein ABIU09_09515, partial [Pyrinomonadaceae bacterium]
TVQRYLKMAPVEWGVEANTSGTGAENNINASSGAAGYFPGHEEFDAAESDPKFANVYEGEPADNWPLRREYWLLGEARRRAHQIYRVSSKILKFYKLIITPGYSKLTGCNYVA